MATPTIADVLIDELALILERRDHPPRKRQVPGEPPPAADPAAADPDARPLTRSGPRRQGFQRTKADIDARSNADIEYRRANDACPGRDAR